VWAAAHVLMAIGVLLPAVWTSLVSVTLAALLVGGTFMVITMVGMQEARARAEGQATRVLGRMTAGFALGQLAGPLVSAGIARLTSTDTGALAAGAGAVRAGAGGERALFVALAQPRTINQRGETMSTMQLPLPRASVR
jgi:MFS family permease